VNESNAKPAPRQVAKSRGWAALMLLLQAGKSQHDVHRETHVSQPSLSKIVNLTKLPSRIDALRLLQYGIEVDWWDVPPTDEQVQQLEAAA
jgi:transcriptional regulator with XRE-family HTH domain